jgi:hypothetical protein
MKYFLGQHVCDGIPLGIVEKITKTKITVHFMSGVGRPFTRKYDIQHAKMFLKPA